MHGCGYTGVTHIISVFVERLLLYSMWLNDYVNFGQDKYIHNNYVLTSAMP